MGIKLNTTGYITSIGEKEAFGDNNVKLRVSFKTEREQYSKYKGQLSSDVKYDTLNCVAYGQVAEYIYKNYKDIKVNSKNSDVRVEVFGHLEADVVDLEGKKLKFISKKEGKKDEYFSFTNMDDDVYYKTTITRLAIKEVTFIDIERTKQTSTIKSNLRSMSTGTERTVLGSVEDEKPKKEIISDTVSDFDEFEDAYDTASNN